MSAWTRWGDEAAQLFPNENVMIVSEQGNFIWHDNPDLIMASTIQEQVAQQNNADYNTGIARMLNGEFGVSIVNDITLNGQVMDGESWAFYTPVAATGWMLSTTLPRANLTSELWSLMSMAIYGLALMIALIIA